MPAPIHYLLSATFLIVIALYLIRGTSLALERRIAASLLVLAAGRCC
jgi:hypothetical protein